MRPLVIKEEKGKRKRVKAESKSSVRASISFSSDLYATLEQIAQHKKVSLAWVVRDAAEKYAVEQRPLPKGSRGWV